MCSGPLKNFRLTQLVTEIINISGVKTIGGPQKMFLGYQIYHLRESSWQLQQKCKLLSLKLFTYGTANRPWTEHKKKLMINTYQLILVLKNISIFPHFLPMLNWTLMKTHRTWYPYLYKLVSSFHKDSLLR